MNIPAPEKTLAELIAAVGDGLTATDRRIAEAVLSDRTLLAFGTVTDLATRVGTSRPSIVRFATRLGFDGYVHLQDHVRDRLSKEISRPRDRIRRADGTDGSTRFALDRALNSVFEAIEGDRLAALAAPLVRASSVWVVSGETSRAGGHALHSGLGIVRPRVMMIEEHSCARELGSASVGDAAVVFDFARYRRHTIAVARRLAEQGVAIVAVTDGPLSPLATLTDTWCGLKVPAVGPFDSSVPAVALAEFLVARVAQELHAEATVRIDRTEAMWEATETFLPEAH